MTTQKKIKGIPIAILETPPLGIKGLASLISADDALTCVGVYASVEETIQRFSCDKPTFLIMDIIETSSSASANIKKIKAQCSGLQVIILTDAEDGDTILESFRAGASGYLFKSASALDVFSAVKEVCRGGSPMSNLIAYKVIEMVRQLRKNHKPAAKAFPRLSSRENQALTHLSNGARYKEIASLMGVSLTSARTYIRRIYTKLSVTSRTEAVAKFLRSNRKK